MFLVRFKNSKFLHLIMKGIVIQFRRGRKTTHEKHFLLDLGAKNREEAKKLAGKEVEWKSPAGKIIKGKISDAHGNKGLVRAIFEKGLPGQAITTDIALKGTGSEVAPKGVPPKGGKGSEKKEAKNTLKGTSGGSKK